MRNVVVCCDGTGNAFARGMTNVLRLYYALDKDPRRQVILYRPGIGTLGLPSTITPVGRSLTKLLGSAVGLGIDLHIRDIYSFLTRHYQPGDRLFLFGFSRGAFTVRAVASLLHSIGILREYDDALVPYVLELLQVARFDPKPLLEFRSMFSFADSPTHFAGVWDTVSSTSLRLPYHHYNPSIRIARQALAIDERRAFFHHDEWRLSRDAPTQDVLQVWFPGVHSDVGGGYPEAESGLAKVSLLWMMGEASRAGLCFDRDRSAEVLGLSSDTPYVRADPNGVLHNSSTAAWTFAEFVPRLRYDVRSRRRGFRVNLARRRVIPTEAFI